MLSKKDKQGILLIVVVIVILIALFAFKVSLDNKPKAGTDNCLGQISANTVILLDHSEAISEQTREEITARAMAHILHNVKENERVSVFTITELSKNSLIPLISLCRPPDDGNRAIENVQSIRKRFQQNFEKPIRDSLAVVVVGSSESPIAQAITDITLSQYLRGSTNSLLVFSDMLEHTAKYSVYKCADSAAVVANYRLSRQGAKERPDFRNTSVILHLIPRNEAKSTLACRDKLWPWFFGNNIGPEAALKMDYLPGGFQKPPAQPAKSQ